MTDVPNASVLQAIKATLPIREGRSKKIWQNTNDTCIIELKPTLHSFTFNRDAVIDGTERLRLDFFELICGFLKLNGINHSFVNRIDERTYLSRYCTEPPIEVIVKNYATGSTTTLYPSLFPELHKFNQPVVKFDFRKDPQDIPIPEDYLRELALPSRLFRKTALEVNNVISSRLPQFSVVDFCLIFGQTSNGEWVITSEISPDSMRIRDIDNNSYDKDLFRRGDSDTIIFNRWQTLINTLRRIA